MPHASLSNQDWQVIVDRLGGAKAIGTLARQTRAFLRARGIATAVDLLGLLLSYCLGERGLRSTAAWASAVGLADISNSLPLRRQGWRCAIGCGTAVIGWPPPACAGARLVSQSLPLRRQGCSPARCRQLGAAG
jgi:hypothetical protein